MKCRRCIFCAHFASLTLTVKWLGPFLHDTPHGAPMVSYGRMTPCSWTLHCPPPAPPSWCLGFQLRTGVQHHHSSPHLIGYNIAKSRPLIIALSVAHNKAPPTKKNVPDESRNPRNNHCRSTTTKVHTLAVASNKRPQHMTPYNSTV